VTVLTRATSKYQYAAVGHPYIHIYQLDGDQTITFVRALEAGLSGKFGDCSVAAFLILLLRVFYFISTIKKEEDTY
jgi:hypothetical protein